MQKKSIQIHSLNINKEFKKQFLEYSGIKAELAQIKSIMPRMPGLRFLVSLLRLFKKPGEFVTISELDITLNKSRFI